MPTPKMRRPRGAATRLRILDAADLLFYQRGIRNVSVEDIIESADTTRMTMYRHFQSKDELALAYLERRADAERRTVEALLHGGAARGADVLELLADAIGLETAAGSFQGCPFLNAAGEFREPGHPVRVIVEKHRAWYRGIVERFLDAAEVDDPAGTADRFVMLRDGAMVRGYFGDGTGQIEALERGVRALLSDEVSPAA